MEVSGKQDLERFYSLSVLLAILSGLYGGTKQLNREILGVMQIELHWEQQLGTIN